MMMLKHFYRCLKTQRFARAGRVKTGRDCWRPYSLVRLNEPTLPCHLRCQTHSELKKEILAPLHDWEYKPCLPAQDTELSHLAQHWLLDGKPTAAQVAERVFVNRLLRALTRTHRQRLGCGTPPLLLNSSRPWSWPMLPNTGMLGSEHRRPGGWSRSDVCQRAPCDQ